jgi:hypothetical protein
MQLSQRFTGFVCVSLKVNDCLEIQRSQGEASFVFLSKGTKYKVIFRVITLLYVEIILDKVQVDPFHLVDFFGGEIGECFGKVIILEAFIVPDFGGYNKRHEQYFAPVATHNKKAAF